MRRRVMPEIREGGVNVTPLIDVVMVMIIFFMLVAKIGVATGAEEEIDIPVSVLGTDIQKIGIESALVLNVREASNLPMVTAMVEPDGRVSMSGRPVELKVFDPVTKRRPLMEVLRKLRHGDAQSGLSANAEFKVIIRGDRSITYKSLDPVLLACMEANVKNVNLNTAKP